MIDFLAHSCLWFTHEPFLISFIILGYFAFSKDIFGKALIILLFSMALNAYLKSLWQIPLSPALGKVGWAFPSGHMQAAVVFWGWLAWEFKRLWFMAFVLLLTGIGASLIHFGYHNLYDIFGAIGFGLLSLVIYDALLRYFAIFKGNPQLLGLLFFVLALPMIYLIPLSLPHLWIAEGALLGFSLGGLLCQPEQRGHILLKLIIAFSGTALTYWFFDFLGKMFHVKHFYNRGFINFVQFLFVGLWISYGTEKLAKIIKD